MRSAVWETTAQVQACFPTAKVLNAERVRFDIAGGDYRLIVAFEFGSQIAFVQFVGTHAEPNTTESMPRPFLYSSGE